MKDKIRKRVEKEANYSAVFLNGKTLRIPLDAKKPITELEYPEFLDLSFGNKCETGKCSFCYAKGNPKGKHYPGIVKKINKYFGNMTDNQRPFQVAIGGQQESLEHPEFWSACEALKNLNIVPNYTTNGVLVDDSACELTNKHCGGLAITCHPHLESHWRRAIDLTIKHKIKTNIHFIVSDESSINTLSKLYDEYKGKIDYFVLLPHMNVGYAEKNPKTIAYDALEKWVDSIVELNDIAFGANLHPFLSRIKKWDISLYPPEILSKFLVFTDPVSLYNSSFDLSVKLQRNWLS